MSQNGSSKAVSDMHHGSIEEILHYRCSECSGWWSYATTERHRPKKLHCPNCGTFNKIVYEEPPSQKNVVKDTGTIKGRGVYAGKHYRENDLVEVSPVIIIEAEYDDLPMAVHRVIYDWEGPEDKTISALALGHGSLFNHANPANMRFDMNYTERTITYFAAKEILKGEELTINYNTEDGAPVSNKDTWFDEMKIKPI